MNYDEEEIGCGIYFVMLMLILMMLWFVLSIHDNIKNLIYG
jgi:hypothetical protein